MSMLTLIGVHAIALEISYNWGYCHACHSGDWIQTHEPKSYHTHSSTEAECITAVNIKKIIFYFKSILEGSGLPKHDAAVIYEDSHGVDGQTTASILANMEYWNQTFCLNRLSRAESAHTTWNNI
jgi:hypothetical protein